jgi:hypothetical protein
VPKQPKNREQLLQDNSERATQIKAELVSLRQRMFQHENMLNVLAIERTNLESDSEEEKIAIPIENGSLVEVEIPNDPKSHWPMVIVSGMVLVAILLGLGGLGIFNNDGSAPVAHRAALPTPHVCAPSAKKGNEEAIDTFSSTTPVMVANSTSDNVYAVPNELPLMILPGITYTSEISYSMRSSAITMIEVSDTPQITLHLSQAPQSFLIPLRTSFRIDSEGIDQQSGTLMVLTDSKNQDVEIRFEPKMSP